MYQYIITINTAHVQNGTSCHVWEHNSHCSVGVATAATAATASATAAAVAAAGAATTWFSSTYSYNSTYFWFNRVGINAVCSFNWAKNKTFKALIILFNIYIYQSLIFILVMSQNSIHSINLTKYVLRVYYLQDYF